VLVRYGKIRVNGASGLLKFQTTLDHCRNDDNKYFTAVVYHSILLHSTACQLNAYDTKPAVKASYWHVLVVASLV